MVHPDAQRILENLEDNREWFASQLSPDSPSSNEIQRNGGHSLENQDGTNLLDTSDSSPASDEQKNIVEGQDGNVARWTNEGDFGREGDAIYDKDDDEGDDYDDDNDDEKTIAETEYKSSSSSRQHTDMSEEVFSVSTSNQVGGESRILETGDKTGCNEVQRREGDDGVMPDKLQVQAEKIQFQIILDEPETEMMNCDNISSCSTRK